MGGLEKTKKSKKHFANDTKRKSRKQAKLH